LNLRKEGPELKKDSVNQDSKEEDRNRKFLFKKFLMAYNKNQNNEKLQ
jgi:hypothetical protein